MLLPFDCAQHCMQQDTLQFTDSPTEQCRFLLKKLKIFLVIEKFPN